MLCLAFKLNKISLRALYHLQHSPLDDDALTRWQRDVGHDDAGQQDAGHKKDSPNVADSKYSHGVINLKQLKEVLVLAMKP
ncbi:unnamed protein product [Trifolium pratense]|uniref:Uncharacterized protein n=1 Tax=Trifolium pratense TaxID=57577 RepID=A0ACB0JHC0_TRIPR|nr:unnamed protein product [Trifolium pratense]